MYSHLVAVEVSVERRTYQWVELDSTTLNEDRLECLDTETVKRGGTVEHYRMILDNVLKCVPYLVVSALDKLSCALYISDSLFVNESLQYERLEELESHFLRKTALIHFQLRSYDDN